MDDNFRNFLESGRKILVDTKTKRPKQPEVKKLPAPKAEGPKDPRESFIKTCIRDKPPKKFVLEFWQEEIEKEEAKL